MSEQSVEKDERCSRLRSGYTKPCLPEEAPCQVCYEANPERWPDMAEWFAEHPDPSSLPPEHPTP